MEACSMEPDGGSIFRNGNVEILEIPVTNRSQLTRTLDSKGYLRSGEILLQNPFDPGQYEPASQAVIVFALEKQRLVQTFLQYLGAKSVKIGESVNEKQVVSDMGELSGSSFGASAQAQRYSQTNELISRRIQALSRFTGGKPDFTEAERILNQLSRSQSEVSTLKFLLKARKGPNRIRRHTFTIDICSEANRVLEVFAKIVLPMRIKQLNLSNRGEVMRTNQYNLEIDVEF